MSDSVIIVIVELDLPLLQMEYPARYVNERINLNEELQFALNVTANPDTLMFSLLMAYENKNFEPVIFKYNVFRFKIWNQLQMLNITE